MATSFIAWLSVCFACIAVGAGGANDARGGISPAARAVRRGNRRLTRNESRYHSGKSYTASALLLTSLHRITLPLICIYS